jgi:Zn-finger nucleic acid-binding protein
MADASSLRCPGCGAAADPDARRCPYCKARLATVSCPSCFALIFDGARFCPKCGARRARQQKDETAGRCPGCRGDLQHVELGATSFLECPACDGVWTDADVFEQLCADREAQARALHHYPAKPSVPVGRVRYRKCVRCGKLMNRVNFGRTSGTVVDVCKEHGTYLDAGELHRIVAFIHGGGLERARQQRIEELKEQERRLQEREWKAARERGISDPHTSLGLGSKVSGRIDLTGLLEMIASARRNSS